MPTPKITPAKPQPKFKPTLPTVDYMTAKQSCYRSITIGCQPHTEQDIMASMERTLHGCDACWIIFSGSHYEAARKASHLSKSITD